MATGKVHSGGRVLSRLGSSAVLGKSILVTVMGKTAIKVLALGFMTSGPVVGQDSLVFASPLADSTTMQDTVAIPLNAAPGTMTITPFLRDSLGQRAVGPSVTITVQSAAQINSVPVVNAYCLQSQAFDNACGHVKRVEVTDTVHVEADDPAASVTCYEVRSSIGGTIEDSQTFVSKRAAHVPAAHVPDESAVHDVSRRSQTSRVFAQNSNGVRATRNSQMARIESIPSSL